jgi:hypothetical protein
VASAGLAELTSYYLAILLALAFLSETHEDIGAALCAAAGLSMLGFIVFLESDDVHGFGSLVVVLLAFYAIGRVAFAQAPPLAEVGPPVPRFDRGLSQARRAQAGR